MRKLHPSSRSHHAFTLVEVLAALVLIGVVLPVAMRGVSLAMREAQHARHIAEAGQLAQQKLHEFLAERDASLFNGQGDFGDQFLDYRWASTGLIRDGSSYDVSVTIYWKTPTEEQSIMLATIVYPNSTTSGATQ